MSSLCHVHTSFFELSTLFPSILNFTLMLFSRVPREITVRSGRAPVAEVRPLVTPGFGPGTSRGTVCDAVTPAPFSHRHGILNT